MNRLILVGNGFDLAHNLKTSYGNFIEDFWENSLLPLSKNYLSKLENDIFCIQCNYIDQIIPQKIKDYKSLIESLKNDDSLNMNFYNRFFEKLMNPYSDNDWVDIENEYYTELLNIKLEKYPDYKIDDLNSHFNEIKKILIDYLNRIEKKITKNNSVFDKIYGRFYYQDLEEKKQLKLLDEIPQILSRNFDDENLSLETITFKKVVNQSKEYGENKEEFIKNKIDTLYTPSSLDLFNLIPDKVLFLNFNYTDTIKTYEKKYESEIVSIHGELNSNENPIIFGFGDDVDKKYQEFEDLNDNKYLENFKSIAYLQTNSYKKLLEFINADEYQIFIFGHSCGISDRTMLNTIFEHDNCKSIKPFYHKRENGSDNYTDIVQNISRNFNDKKKFRDRVVNKTYCEPLT